MTIECPSCQVRYSIDEARIPAQGAKTLCKKCGQSIIIPPLAAATCPKCNRLRRPGDVECPFCDVIYDKAKRQEDMPSAPAAESEADLSASPAEPADPPTESKEESTPAPPPEPSVEPDPNLEATLRQLYALRTQGLLTDQELSAKKALLLDIPAHQPPPPKPPKKKRRSTLETKALAVFLGLFLGMALIFILHGGDRDELNKALDVHILEAKTGQAALEFEWVLEGIPVPWGGKMKITRGGAGVVKIAMPTEFVVLPRNTRLIFVQRIWPTWRDRCLDKGAAATADGCRIVLTDVNGMIIGGSRDKGPDLWAQ